MPLVYDSVGFGVVSRRRFKGLPGSVEAVGRFGEVFISSRSGRASPVALAARSASCTVDVARPKEKATLRWLIPMAVSLGISLYLTTLSLCSRIGRSLRP